MGFDHRWAWGRQLGGGSAKFRPGGVVFGPPGGWNKFRLSGGGGKGRGIKDKTRKKYFLVAAKKKVFCIFEQK